MSQIFADMTTDELQRAYQTLQPVPAEELLKVKPLTHLLVKFRTKAPEWKLMIASDLLQAPAAMYLIEMIQGRPFVQPYPMDQIICIGSTVQTPQAPESLMQALLISKGKMKLKKKPLVGTAQDMSLWVEFLLRTNAVRGRAEERTALLKELHALEKAEDAARELQGTSPIRSHAQIDLHNQRVKIVKALRNICNLKK